MSAPITTASAEAPGHGSSDTAPDRRRRWTARSLVWFVGVYQALRTGRPSPCRFWPTCSAYAVEAVERHGAARGLLLAVRRILRCHPWGGSGVDVVPE